jgi:hypothetical protein
VARCGPNGPLRLVDGEDQFLATTHR